MSDDGLIGRKLARKLEESGEAESCPLDLMWEEKQGVKEYIQRKTDEDPYYALVTGALHGATVDYTVTQPYVDIIVDRGAEDWTDAKTNIEFLSHPQKNGQYLVPEPRGEALAKISKCYVDKREAGLEKREAAMACSDLTRKNRLHGFGRKGTQLMREYLGDENAVAVDRHVYTYMCLKYGVCPPCTADPGFGIGFSDKSQRIVEEALAVEAKKCGKTPVEMQVAAWLKGACDSRMNSARSGTNIYLGEDMIIDCTLKDLDNDIPLKPQWRQLMPEARKICQRQGQQTKRETVAKAGHIITKNKKNKVTGKTELAYKQATLNRDLDLGFLN